MINIITAQSFSNLPVAAATFYIFIDLPAGWEIEKEGKEAK